MLQRARDHGARFLVCGTDMSVLLGGFRAMRAEMDAGARKAVATGKSGGYM